ncbi:MAG TPA: PDZ domain-containing protein [Kofleriaceae bacterium]
MLRAALVIVAACSDSPTKTSPPAVASSADARAAIMPSPDADLALAASWIGVRLDGLTIVDVIDSTPAKQAGVLAGDQLVSLYGAPVESVRDFVEQIRRMPPGATIPLVVSRGGEELKLSITVVERPLSAAPLPY